MAHITTVTALDPTPCYYVQPELKCVTTREKSGFAFLFCSPRREEMPPRIRELTPDSEELDELDLSGESEFEQESEGDDQLEEAIQTVPASSVLKIKFKLSAANCDPPSTSKGQGKQRMDSDEEELSEFDSEEHFSDQSAQSSMSAARMTARQRAKEMGGETGQELQSLPPGNRITTRFLVRHALIRGCDQ